MKRKNKIRIIFCLLLSAAFHSDAQTPDEMNKLYPGKLAVFTGIRRNLDISFKEGTPLAEANEVTEMMIIDEKANGMFSRDRVYHSTFNELKKIDAYTLVTEGNSTKKLKATDFKTESSHSQNVFYDDAKETLFNYPKMMKGSIAHVETDMINKDIHFLSPFYFSSYLPVHYAEYTVSYPENIDLKYIVLNDDNKTIRIRESKKGKTKKIEFSSEQVPSFEYFDDGISASYFAPHVLVYVAGYKSADGEQKIFGDPDRLYKWSSSFLSGIRTIAGTDLKKLTDSISAAKKDNGEKTAAIYNWVQSHVKYVAFEQDLEGFIPRQADEVFAKRYGDCKDMANLLTVMLNAAGIDAHLAWIGTRSIPYSYNMVPLPLTDNHMICVADINGSKIFLDATDPNCIFGFPSSGIQGKQAMISLSADKYVLSSVPVMPAAASLTQDSSFLRINGNLLSGTSTVYYNGYPGNDLYDELRYSKGEDEKAYIRKKMARGNNKMLVKNYHVAFTDPLNKKAVITSEYDIPDYIKSAGDMIFVNLNPAKLLKNNQVDTSMRKHAPIEIEYLSNNRISCLLEIPAGYALDYLPPNMQISNDLASFSVTYTKDAGRVIATQELQMKKLYIMPADFNTWNDMQSKAATAYKEQIVLKRNPDKTPL